VYLVDMCNCCVLLSGRWRWRYGSCSHTLIVRMLTC